MDNKNDTTHEFAFDETPPQPKIDPAQILAYHEAGHFFMNYLLRQVKFELNFEITFPFPESAMINERKNEGRVELAGFPIIDWNTEKVKSVLPAFFEYPKFYLNNKRFTIANIFLAIAGHVADVAFVRKDRGDYLSFGNVTGERSDKANFDNLVGLILDFDNNASKEYKQASEDLFLFMRKELNELMSHQGEALHLIAKALLEKPFNEDEERKLSKPELHDLNSKLDEIVKNVNLSGLIDKFIV